ncbi:MAG: RNA polymerase sigma factor [Thermoanaerobaculia bacterium]|nr:RNA polymerase sigma factor [Thermoanaerobaculia bacterium]
MEGQTISDDEAMARVRDGDLARLSILFDRHHRRLFGYCFNFVRDRTAAEDLVQEVFVRMLKYRHSYREQGRFEAWMFRMARNVCLDHVDRRGIEIPVEEIPREADESPEAGPDAVAAGREELRILERALGRLPEEKRDLLLLARFGSLTYDEIAETLGCTVGALKVRVHRALKQLEDQYAMASEGRAS